MEQWQRHLVSGHSMCCHRGQGLRPRSTLSMVTLVSFILFITHLVCGTAVNWGEGPLTEPLGKEALNSPSQAFVVLSDGIEIKLHPIYNESLSYPLPPVRLDSRHGQERIVHLRTLIVDCDVSVGTNDSRVHLFWLQSKPSRIFHGMVNMKKKQLERTKLILPNSQTSGTKLPLETTNVSYFDVISSCGKCDDELTYYLTVVNEVAGVITMITLDSQFNVKGRTVAINGTNPGQVSVTSHSVFWLQDSSCLKVIWPVDADKGSAQRLFLPSLLALDAPASTWTSKLLCINQYSSEAAATAFHVTGTRGNYANYIYLITSTGDLLRLLPSSDAAEGTPFQMLFSSAMYAERDVLRQHATTFNGIQVMQEKNLVRVFLSIKSQGFLIQLAFDCPPDPYDEGDLRRFFAAHRSPCRFLGHKNILAERHLFDFAIIDLENSASRCGYLNNGTDSHPVAKTSNANATDSWLQLQNETITVTMATVSTWDKDKQNRSPDTSAITKEPHFDESNVNSTHVRPTASSTDEPSFSRSWVKTLALPGAVFILIVIIALLAIYYGMKKRPSAPAPDDHSEGDSTCGDYWSDQQPLTNISAAEQVHSGHSNLGSSFKDSSGPISFYNGSLSDLRSTFQGRIQSSQEGNCNGYTAIVPSVHYYLDRTATLQGNTTGAKSTSVGDRKRIRGHNRKSPPKEQREDQNGLGNFREQSLPPIAIEDIGDGFNCSNGPLSNVTGEKHLGKGASESGGQWRKMIALTNGTSANGACGDCNYKSECREKGICLNTYRMLN